MKSIRTTIIVCLLFAVGSPFAARAAEVGPAGARALAREGYLYGVPLVMNYKTMYQYAVWKESPDYKAPFNQIRNVARLFTPEDKAFVTPNADTPHSFAWLDLRAEPVVLSAPQVETGRYFSILLIDLYTHNLGYIGTRATGNASGHFLIAGPGWKGETPRGISRVERGFSAIVSLLDRLGEGVSEDEAFAAVFGQGYADLCRRWAESFEREGGR